MSWYVSVFVRYIIQKDYGIRLWDIRVRGFAEEIETTRILL